MNVTRSEYICMCVYVRAREKRQRERESHLCVFVEALRVCLCV